MTQGSLKAIGVACILVALGALFVAVDQYRNNAVNVAAINNSDLGTLIPGGHKLEPATPTATKYALVVALLAGVGASISLYAAFSKRPPGAP